MSKILKSWFFLTYFMVIFSANAENDILEVDLHIRNHRFIPDVLELPSGTKIHLIVHNQDETIEEFESHDLKREKIILGNSLVKIILAPLKVGEYKFFGEFHDETAQGKIIVKE